MPTPSTPLSAPQPLPSAPSIARRVAARAPLKPSSEQESEALLAITHGNTQLLRKLVQATPTLARLQSEPRGRRTLLMNAAFLKDPACVRLLLPLSDPLAQDYEGNTALCIAVQHGNIDCVKALLPSAELTRIPRPHRDLLHLAAVANDAECIRLLLPSQDPNALSEQRHVDAHYTPLALSILAHNGLSFEALLPVSDSRLGSNDGLSALMLAAHEPDPRFLRALLPGGDVNALDGETGDTVLMRALRGQSVENFRMLLPLSDLLTRNQAGEDVDQLAWTLFGETYGEPGFLECWDLLAPSLPIERVQSRVAGAPAAALESIPQALALLERHALATALCADGLSRPSSASSDASTAAGASAPVPAKRRRIRV